MIISAALTRTLEYDICVIGSGPAALTFAGQFLESRSNLKVLLVESGETLDPAYSNEHDESLSRRYNDLQTSAQALYGGRLSGWLGTNKPDYLTESRLRAFGGTGNVWSGWLCAMERLDLERGKWPVSYAQMMSFYEKSARTIRSRHAGAWMPKRRMRATPGSLCRYLPRCFAHDRCLRGELISASFSRKGWFTLRM
ncbi:hypothetical protein C4K18_3023 [Pseudomonas chlororaphis subsp. aurantiaca]|nr:hypothetical protein C4K18_3023 [Pseudomonas chlororaphis subsp. aurantiaca]